MSGVEIKRMASKVPVNGVGGKDTVTEYAVVPIYINGRNSSGEDVTAMIHAEVRLVDSLKANMLFGTDVMIPERVDLLLSRKEMHIGSCGVTVTIDAKPRATHLSQAARVRSNTTVPAHTQLAVPVKNQLPTDRDFIFVPKDAPVSVFCHMVDSSTGAILVRNESDAPVMLKRNTRLGVFTEFDDDGCFAVEATEYDLALKPTKHTEQKSWFCKAMKAAAGVLAMSTGHIDPDGLTVGLSGGTHTAQAGRPAPNILAGSVRLSSISVTDPIGHSELAVGPVCTLPTNHATSLTMGLSNTDLARDTDSINPIGVTVGRLDPTQTAQATTLTATSGTAPMPIPETHLDNGISIYGNPDAVAKL